MDATELALLAGVCADPADDTARLVMADYYTETGREERGEFIRVQCELARLPECGFPAYEDGKRCNQTARPWSTSCRACILRKREQELYNAPHSSGLCYNYTEWAGKAASLVLPRSAADTYRFSRGYLSSLTCTSSAFLQHAGNLIWRPDSTICAVCGDRNISPMFCSHTQVRVPRPCPMTAQPIEEVTLTDWPRLNVVGDGSPVGVGLTYSINGVPGDYTLLSLTTALRLKPPLRALRADEVVRGIFGVRFPGVKFNLPSSYALGENVTLNPQRLHLQIRVPQELVDEMDRGTELSDLARDRAEAWQFAERAAAAVYTVPEGRMSRVEQEVPAGAPGYAMVCNCLEPGGVRNWGDVVTLSNVRVNTVSLAPTVRIRTTRGTMYAPFAGQCSACRRVFVAIRQDRPQSA